MKDFHQSIKKQWATRFAALLVLLLLGPATLTKAQNIVYPPNSGIVHMVNDYGIVANNISEAGNNTAKIQQAIDANKGQSFGRRSGILYFPNGTYYVNNKMSLGVVQEDCRYITFQGQSRTGTVLKMADGSAGFEQGANKPVIVFTEASGTNSGFKNYIKNLTIDIGANNPGAIGVDFICNNHGGLFDVTIKSTDSQKRGAIGLKMDRNLGGIGLIKNVRIEGFDIGIKTGNRKSNYVFEHIELDGQNVAGIQNTDKPLSIRKLTTTNINGPAIVNTTAPGHIVLIDSELGGSGEAAIDNRQGFVFVRNVTSSGYSNTINDRDSLRGGPYISEYSSHSVYRLWESTPPKSLNLEIKETPEIPWEQDFSKWVLVDPSGNGAEDDAPAIQAAIDSCTAENGKNTVCIRVSTDNANKVTLKTPIVIRGNVQRFLVLGALFELREGLLTADGAVFTLESTNYDVLEVEGIDVSPAAQTLSQGDLTMIQNNSPKTVVLRDVATRNGRRFYRNGPSAGPLFVEVGGHQYSHPQVGPTVGWEFINQDVWARNINPEDVNTGFINDGGRLWILGYKFENDVVADHFITKNGGFTEVLGGIDNGVFTEDTASAIHINDNSNVSHISAERANNSESTRHTVVIREIRGEVTREFKYGDFPTVSAAVSADPSQNFGLSSVIPLYVGYDPVAVSKTYTFSDFPYFNDARNYDEFTPSRWEVFTDGAENRRYIINTTDYSNQSGKRLGEYSIVKDRSYGDFTMTLKASSKENLVTNPDADFAAVFGFVSANNYCYMLFSGQTATTQLFRVNSGARQLIATATGKGILDNTYHDIELKRTGNKVTVKRNGTQILSATNSLLGTAGRVGIGSYNDAAYFDAIRVSANSGGGARIAQQNSSSLDMQEEQSALKGKRLSCYPNPATGTVNLTYYLSTAATVRLEVYNIVGSKVATLVQSEQEAGAHQAIFDTSALQESVYLGRLQTGNEIQTVKILLVKN